MNISVRQMQAFLAVYQQRSITRAAERLNLTQSAVSVLIRQMEELLGFVLFERTTRSLKPTPAAHEAASDVERLLRELDQMNAKLRGLARKTHGHVSLAISAGLAAGLGGAILNIFHRQYPGVRVRIHDVAPNQVIARVLDEEVEFGIGAMELNRSDVVQDILATDTVSAIGLSSNGLGERATMTWHEVSRLTTITTPKSEPLRLVIDEALRSRNIQLEPTFEVSFLTTALAMAAHGVGVAIVPSNVLPFLRHPQLVDVPLVEPTVRRHLCLIKNIGAPLSPAAQSFVAVAREVLHTRAGLLRPDGASGRAKAGEGTPV